MSRIFGSRFVFRLLHLVMGAELGTRAVADFSGDGSSLIALAFCSPLGLPELLSFFRRQWIFPNRHFKGEIEIALVGSELTLAS